MKIFLITILGLIILSIGCFSGIYLLADFIWWKTMLFFLEAKIIGEVAFRIFRWIDCHFA